MKSSSHLTFAVFLSLIAFTAIISLSVRGCDFYGTPVAQRPFRPDYAQMRPSGPYSHTLGILGSALIFIGVTTYSCRKRVRRLWELGKLSRWLEFHIVVCLVGPILIVYHTTFKAGGIAAVSLWTMLSVAARGIIGRFLYVQIPRNIQGMALTLDEISEELRGHAETLRRTDIGTSMISMIDAAFANIAPPRSLPDAFRTFIRLERAKSGVRKLVARSTAGQASHNETLLAIRATAMSRATLLQRSVVLAQFERMFFYWHAIHLPFSIIMFVTLAAHVAVAIALGYTWIF
jgi:hypothetical protein